MALDDPGPFRVNVYDKAFAFQFPLGGIGVSVTPRHLAKGTGTLTVPLKHKRTDALFTPGQRCTIDYLTGKDRSDDASWLRIMSGKLYSKNIAAANVPAAGKLVGFGVESDWRVMESLLGWAVPGSAIGSQGAAAYDVRTGDAETVLKGYLGANVGRLPYSVTMATNAHRGSTVFGSIRFQKLSEMLPPIALAGGVGMTFDQVGSGIVADVYVPTDRTARVFTEESGALLSWALATTGPSATAAIVATDGEGTLRHFALAQDTALRDEWGEYVEAFVDARDLVNTQTSEIAQRAAHALADGAPQAGWSVTLAETDVVRYGKNLFVGDRIAVQITPKIALSDILSECTLTWGVTGLTVSPLVGNNTAQVSPDRFTAALIAKVARAVQQLRSSL